MIVVSLISQIEMNAKLSLSLSHSLHIYSNNAAFTNVHECNMLSISYALKCLLLLLRCFFFSFTCVFALTNHTPETNLTGENFHVACSKGSINAYGFYVPKCRMVGSKSVCGIFSLVVSIGDVK